MLLCFQIRVNFTLVLCIACYHFEFGIAASISGLWTIKPNGSFEAVIDATSTSGKKQTFRTTGKVSIKNGKVLSQVETLNGKRPAQLPPTQSYTLLADGKTLQADNQPVKLVKQ